jgi:small subunit ribosomal protein S19e
LGIFDVPASRLIDAVASDLKARGVKAPAWVDFVKTGRHRERAPTERDWWHTREASVLYRLYADGPVGTERLRTYYGGRKARGTRPHKFYKAGGKIIRVCLQQLEQLGFVAKDKKGRKVSAKGQGYLNEISKKVAQVLREEGAAKTEIHKEAEKEKALEKERAVGAELKKIEKMGHKEKEKHHEQKKHKEKAKEEKAGQ